MRARRGILGLALATLVPVVVVLSGSARPAVAAAPVGAHPMAYAVARELTQTVVSVIDTTNNAQVTTVPLVDDASGIAITPDARFALVVLDGLFAGTGSRPAAGPVPTGALPLQAGMPTGVVAINTSTNQLVPGVLATLPAPTHSIAVAPDGSKAFVVIGQGQTCTSACFPVSGTVVPITIGAGPTLTPGAAFPLPNPLSNPIDAAVSPDGTRLYVVTNDGFMDTLALPSGAQAAPTYAIPGGNASLEESASAINVSPDGASAYIAVMPTCINSACFPNPPGFIDQVALGADPHELARIAVPPANQGSIPRPTAMTMSTTPAGASTLWVADSAGLTVVPIPLPPPGTLTPISLANVQTPANGLAATPDGSTVEFTTSRNLSISIDAGARTLRNCFAVTPTTCPEGAAAIAVTPDQRPVASFAVVPAGPGQPTSFDASSSTIAFGTITRYHWDFGDGQSQDTTGPTTTHPYATGGGYTATLTETDWAGTSVATTPPSTVFTGQTMTRRGGPEAQARHQFTVPVTPTSPIPSISPSGSPSPIPPGLTPKLTLDPKVGPPGSVVAVSGSGFPANTSLTLGWHPGIGTTGVTTNGTGVFTNRFVLVFPKDRLGDRLMMAQGYTATATFLVVPPPLAPGGSGGDVVLLFRR